MSSASSTHTILSVRSLSIAPASGSPLLVERVSFDLRPGEVLGLIGESGAGKSTIGMAALGYTRPGCRVVSGQVLLNGIDIFNLPDKQRQALRGSQIGYVAQSAAASFNPAYRLRDQVCEILVDRGVAEPRQAHERAARLFRELDLPDPASFGSRFPHQVSGGQLQRAMAAMAIAPTPKVIVFDEPTTALDVTTQVEVLAAFRNLIKKHGAAAIYIAHDLAVVAQLADHILVLRHGNMVEHGSTQQILEDPQEEYTRRLVAERTKLHRPSAASAGAPVLSMTNVSAGYRQNPNVICDIDLTVGRGETVAVVGESGSGKTSLARTIIGVLPCEKGTIHLNGDMLAPSFQRRSREQLRSVQLIYQMPDVALNPHHTVLDTIGRPLRFYFGLSSGQLKDRVAELLEETELPAEFMHRRTATLSGGQKQRVCIARALAAQPDLIICDEATSALDPLVSEEILTLLSRLQARLNTGMLFITHDLGIVQRISSRAVVMRYGRIVDSGMTEELFAPPMHEYTQLLLASVPRMTKGWLDHAISSRATANS